MRLTADLIRGAPAYINPLKERELSLRGYKISKIENLGVTEDQYDVIDLSDNEILKLENFPLLQKLQAILLNNNRICRIAKGLGEFLPRLASLILSNNKITSLSDIDPLAELSRLTHLSLLNNPVTKQDHYRLYVIHKLPRLKVLDFRRVKPTERSASEKRFGKSDTKDSKTKTTTTPLAGKTFVVGEGVPRPTSKKGLTLDHKRKIMEAIKKASSLGEIERLEKILSSGKMPADFDEGTPQTTQPQQTEKKAEGKSEQDSAKTKETVPTTATSSENKKDNKKPENAEVTMKGGEKEKDSLEPNGKGEKVASSSTTTRDIDTEEPLADEEADVEDEGASVRAGADTQVDIEMAE